MSSAARAARRRAAREAARSPRTEPEYVRWCRSVAQRITGIEPTVYPDGTWDVPGMTDAQWAEYAAAVHPEMHP